MDKGQTLTPQESSEESQADPANANGSRVSGRVKRENTGSEEKSGTSENQKEKPKEAPAPTERESVPALIQPSILMRSLSSGPFPQPTNIPAGAPQATSPPTDGIESGSNLIAVNSRTVPSLPVETDNDPKGNIAFGLRLTIAKPDEHASAAPSKAVARLQLPDAEPVSASPGSLPTSATGPHSDPSQVTSPVRPPALIGAAPPVPITASSGEARGGSATNASDRSPSDGSDAARNEKSAEPPPVRNGSATAPASDRAASVGSSSAKPAPRAIAANRPLSSSLPDEAPPFISGAARNGWDTADASVNISPGEVPAREPNRNVAVPQAASPHPASGTLDSIAEAGGRAIAPENTSPPPDRHGVAPAPPGRLVKTPQQNAAPAADTASETLPKAPPPEAGGKHETTDRAERGSDPVTVTLPTAVAAGAEAGVTSIGKSNDGASGATKAAVEPETNAAPPPQLQPARQISLKMTGENSTRVDVEVSERAGKVLVAVRTSDQDLTKSLQSNLGTLVGRLEDKGFKTDAWVPAVHEMAAPALQQSSGNNGGEASGSGTGQQGQPGRQGQNGSPRQQARWMAQVDETLSTEETSIEDQ